MFFNSDRVLPPPHSGNARKKTFFSYGGVPLLPSIDISIGTNCLLNCLNCPQEANEHKVKYEIKIQWLITHQAMRTIFLLHLLPCLLSSPEPDTHLHVYIPPESEQGNSFLVASFSSVSSKGESPTLVEGLLILEGLERLPLVEGLMVEGLEGLIMVETLEGLEGPEALERLPTVEGLIIKRREFIV